MKKKYVITCAILILVIVVLQFVGKGRGRREARHVPLYSIETTQLENRDFDTFKGYIGTLYPSHEFKLHSKVGGRITKMHYDVGDRLPNGVIVAEIDDVRYGLEFKQARAKLNIEESKVRQKEMSIAMAEKEYKRMQALRDELVISESDLEKAKYDFEQKIMTLEADRANLQMQQTAVEMANLNSSYTDIQALWRGDAVEDGCYVLAERFVDEGAMITSSTALGTIMNIGLLEAEIFIGEKEYPYFRPGMKVEISVDAFPDDLFEGSVYRVAPFINEQTRQAKVLVTVKNDDLRLRPGMFSRVRVVFNSRSNVPMLPDMCVIDYKGKKGVFLYDAETELVAFQELEIGVVRDGFAEILNPEAITKPVVSVGQHMLKDELKVRLLDKNAEAEEQIVDGISTNSVSTNVVTEVKAGE